MSRDCLRVEKSLKAAQSCFYGLAVELSRFEHPKRLICTDSQEFVSGALSECL
jgi:hypothetical protein